MATPVRLSDMIDPKTNRTRTRVVDITSDMYRVARAYMIRLETEDLENPAMLQKLAAEARCRPDEFRERFARAATRRPKGLPRSPEPSKDEVADVGSAARQPS